MFPLHNQHEGIGAGAQTRRESDLFGFLREAQRDGAYGRRKGMEWKGKEWFSKDSLSPMKSDNDGIVIGREKTSNVNESGCCVSL